MILLETESMSAFSRWDDGYLVGQRYSKQEIVNAGKVLGGKPDLNEETIQAFRVAHEWRSSHVFPMREVRAELAKHGSRLKNRAITAARLKRMQSIRKKLHKTPLSLIQIQDIAGCRAIVKDMRDLAKLTEKMKAYRSWPVVRLDDYIASPRRTGYRSMHIVLKFNGWYQGQLLDRQRVEIQIRTALQHAWATAVEAVGMVLGQDMKAGDGDKDWLRLFVLMASEFAAFENQPIGADVSEVAEERQQEIRAINSKIDALTKLGNWNHSIKYSEKFASRTKYQFYLIQYEPIGKSLSIKPFEKYSRSYAKYIEEERDRSIGTDTVLVEVDRISDLKAAYPNYFLDVETFRDRLARIVNTVPDESTVLAPIRKPLFDLRGTRWAGRF